MIITCPACSAKFAVKATAIGPEGRNVKCAKCQNAWFQKPEAEALAAAQAVTPEPVAVAPVPQGSNVPAQVEKKVKKPFPVQLASLIAASVVFLIAVGFYSGNKAFISMFGMHDTSELALYDVKFAKEQAGKYEDLVISGRIVNESDAARYVPDLRLTIYDNEKSKLKTATLDSEGAMLEAGEGVDFETRVPRIPKKTATVVVDLGNGLDLAAR